MKALLSIAAFVTPVPGAHQGSSGSYLLCYMLFTSYFLSLVLSAAGVFPSWNLGIGYGKQ